MVRETERQRENSPFFSVCMPVCNGQAYLAEAIESVLGQSWGDYELILVDDGSTDRSGRICDAYGEKYPQIRVIHKENEGLVLARWEAVKAARGQYLTFLDADDRYVPHTLAAVRQGIENTGADLVVFDFCKVFPEGSVRDITEPYADHTVFSGEGKQQLYRDFLWGHRLNSLCRKCIRRDLYDLGENPEQYRGVVQGEDKLASLGCLDRAEKIVYLKSCLYEYRMNGQSTTHNLTLKNYRDVQMVYRKSMGYIRRWNLPETVVAQLQKQKLHMAFLCGNSLARRISEHKATARELREGVRYISEDPEFVRAYANVGREIPVYQRWFCGLMLRRQMTGIRLYSSLLSWGQKLRRWLGHR